MEPEPRPASLVYFLPTALLLTAWLPPVSLLSLTRPWVPQARGVLEQRHKQSQEAQGPGCQQVGPTSRLRRWPLSEALEGHGRTTCPHH